MRISHLAIWCSDLELMRQFYEKYFNATSNGKYHNPKTGFSSYFISFPDGPRLELMNRPDLGSIAIFSDISDLDEELGQNDIQREYLGYAHIALELGSEEAVLNLTESLRADGYTIASEPRITGDGYFESVIVDPEGNLIELTQ